MAKLPSQFDLMHLLQYEAETGILLWLPRPPSMFANGAHSASHRAAKWNRRYAGQSAISIGVNGYGYTTINDRAFLSHRLIWKLLYNTEPDEIDHENGARTDNRIGNLRDVTRPENMRNMKRSKRNSSGATGVSFRKDRGHWRAYIFVGGRQISLGTFATAEEAAGARKKAEDQYGFHANHGR